MICLRQTRGRFLDEGFVIEYKWVRCVEYIRIGPQPGFFSSLGNK